MVCLRLPRDNWLATFQNLADRRVVDLHFRIEIAFHDAERHRKPFLLRHWRFIGLAVQDEIAYGVVAFLPILLRRQMEVMDAVEQRRRIQFAAPVGPANGLPSSSAAISKGFP